MPYIEYDRQLTSEEVARPGRLDVVGNTTRDSIVFGELTLTPRQRNIWEEAMRKHNNGTTTNSSMLLKVKQVSPITLAQAFDLLEEQMEAQKQAAAESARVQMEAERNEQIVQAMRQQQQEEAGTLPWNEEGRCSVDLRHRLLVVSGLRHNPQLKSWFKKISVVDYTQTTGYMYRGLFIDTGRVNMVNEDAVFLVAATAGSKGIQNTAYSVVILKDGRLQPAGIEDNGLQPGWAMRLRDKVASLLPRQPEHPFADLRALAQGDQPIVEVPRERLEALLRAAHAL